MPDPIRRRRDPAPAVSAVILTYRRQDLLAGCLDSVERALAAVEGATEIVVVDNGSPENRASARIAELCPPARIVTLRENRGYAGGLNAGLEVARGQWILTIGDDATIEPPAVAAMLGAGRRGEDVGSVAAKMLFADRSGGDVVNSAGLEIDRLGTAVDRLVGAPDADVETETTEVFGTSGGAALYRRAMLEEIGGFDETFGVYLEDADVAWRARMAGWRCLLEPGAVVRHHHSATTRHRSDYKYFHVGRNRVRMLAKNATAGHLVRYAPLMVLYDLASVAYALAVDRTTAPLRGRIQGLRDWRRQRAAQPVRRAVALAPARGLRAALARNAAAWSRGSTRRP
jgi:GT2 family glycosyltransferase